MHTSTIRIALRTLPEQFDRSRIDAILEEIETTLSEEAGVYGNATANSMTISIDVPTDRLADAATTLAAAGII